MTRQDEVTASTLEVDAEPRGFGCVDRQQVMDGGPRMVVGGVETCASNAVVPSNGAVEQRYRYLLDHNPNPMCVHAEGCVVYVNPAGARAIAAASVDELVGRMITDFVHPDSIAPMLDRIAALRREGDSTDPAEAVMLRLDGSTVDAEIVSVLSCWDGKPAYQVIFRDLTTIKAAQATLRYQAALVTHATDAIIATTFSGTVTSWNRAADTIYQRSAAHAVGSPITQAVGAAVDPAAIVARGGVEHATHHTAEGTALTVRIAAAAMDDGYVFVCSDQTALRRAELRFRTVVNSLEEGVVVFDASGQPQWINPAGRHILGLPDHDTPASDVFLTRGFPVFDVEGHPLGEGQRPFERALATGVAVRNEMMGYDRPDGTRVWLSTSARLLDPAQSGPPTVLATFTDVTDQHHAHIRLNHQAHHDALTGLPNRAYAEARASHALQTDPPTLAAVMFIDLDNIKTFNDAYGHHAGDTVIKAAAGRLRATLRTEDFVARQGGDEFVALLFGPANRAALEHLTDRLHAALATPLTIAGIPCTLTASIGVTEVQPHDRRDASQLLQDADAAMYKAKVYRAGTHYADPPNSG
jgi:diguanylate cyclase (GGDEF)-like protein/PAS domain S-box-containing protein